MHKRVERILISAAIIIAALYALVSFWPVESPPPAPAFTPYPFPTEPTAETVAETKRIEAEAIATLIRIGSAELSFHGLHERFGSVEDLVREKLLNKKYSNGVIISGYQYNLAAAGEHFAAYGDPIPGPGRHFYIDQTLDLRYDDNGRGSPSSPYLSYSKNETSAPAGDTPAEPAAK
jgi:hypothetical protein